MATLRGLGTYDKKLRADLEELSTNIWMGLPADGNKSGNLRGVYIVVTLPSPANTSFAVGHELGEVPLGYRMIGTPTSSIVELHPGTNADGSRIPWTERRIYLKSPITDKEITLEVWGTDSGV